jgi:hypothetical protein
MARFTHPGGGEGSGIPGPQGDPGAPGADGVDGADALWNFLGEWQNGVDYAAGSVVQYQGSSYYHPDGQFSSYNPPGYGWLLVSSKGDTGENGADGDDGAPGADGNDGSPGLVYLGNYVSGNGYLANVAVVKGSDNNLYIATSSGGLSDPVGNTAEWSIFLPKGADGDDGEDGVQGDPGPQGESGVSEVTVFTVQGGVVSGTQPTFNGAPLFTGSYIRIGDLVHFQIQVDFDNITSFGSGQYYVNLPFPARYDYQMREGNVDDFSTSRKYSIGGHVFAASNQLRLNFLDSQGRDTEFTYNTPFVLAVQDNFHISGTYIAEAI